MSSTKKDRISSSRTSTEKEAKALSDELYALLGKKDPWHQDVVFARENLRRHCLALIFKPVADSDSSNVVAAQSKKRLQGLNVLFLSTSHNVIHHFRQRLSAMDKLMAQAASERSNSRSGRDRAADAGGKRGDRSNPAGSSGTASSAPTPAQRRRLLHSFRDFLAKEEIFWRDLLIRIVGVFDVEEARTPLRLLQLGVGDWEPEPRFSGNKEIHDQAILLCHKTLICFGDLARYKELYSENRNEKAPKPRGGKLAPKPAETEKDKSWSRAYEAYHQARLLVPDDGNPSNQLAVLAGYQHDNLSTVYHYYRALCVRKAFTAARQNLAPTFAKILSHWESAEKHKADKRKLRAGNGTYSDIDEDEHANLDKMDATVLVEDFKKAFVVLHAILFQATHMDRLAGQFTIVTRMFSACVRRRILPSDVVVKVIVTAISAWWYARMYKKSSTEATKGTTDTAALESSALMHALAMLSELMSIAVKETQDVELPELLQHPPTLAKRERPMLLAQSITAILRRALPALRISSMWLLSNADYLARYDNTSALFKANDASIPPEVCAAIRGFWSSYIAFANAMSKAFPSDLLPATSGDLMLEEDIDMLGFAPLRRRMKEASIGKAAKEVSGAIATAAATSSTLHPNEEQVLRVSDLLADAGLLAQSEACPVVVEAGRLVIRKKRLNPASQPWNPIKAVPATEARVASPASVHREDDGNDSFDDLQYANEEHDSEESDEDYEATEDDVLDLAMRVATGNNDSLGQDFEDDAEDDDEEILYPTKVTQASYTNRQTANTPSPPSRHALPSAITQSSAAAAPTRTASDLLLQVLQGNSMDLRSSPTIPAAIPPGLGSAASLSASPFVNTGSSPAPAGLAGHSIWSGSPFASTSSSPAPHQRVQSDSNSLLNPGGSAGAEALFNSMPNQSQQPQQPIGSGIRNSSSVGSFGLGAANDIWGAPPSPRRNVGMASMQNQQAYQPAVPSTHQQSNQYGRQYG